MATTDSYVGAKANLRDNVKTLIGIFGGVVGVLLAGTPFSGYGSVELWSTPWWFATIGLLGAVSLVAWALRILLFLLRTDLAYSQDLVTNFSKKPPASDPLAGEIKALQVEFDEHKVDLLPKGVKSVADLDIATDVAWNAWLKEKTDANRKVFDDRFDALQKLNYWSAFIRFHYRVTRGIDKVLLLGLASLFFVGMFALAASPKKKDEGAAQTVVNNVAAAHEKPIGSAHPVATVHFETNRWALSAETLAEIGAIRDHLRARPLLGVLVFAYTDTRGGSKLNQGLAQRRAEVVANALVVEGGISPTRVFATALPKADLPQLTSQEVDSAENRAVELRVIDLPERK